MSLFRRGRRSGWPPPTDSLGELLRRRESISFDAGVTVDASTAQRHGAVFACRDLIGREISTLPLDQYKKIGGVFAPLPPVRLLESPDRELDIADIVYQQLSAMLCYGNAYALITEYDREGWPTTLRTLPNESVSYERKGRIGDIEWRLEGKTIRKYPAGDLWHIPAYLLSGYPIGMSPISYAALTIGHGIAAQQFAARYFRDGAIPVTILKNEAEVNETLARLIQDRWNDALAGNRKTVALGDGWEPEFPSITAQESQFLEAIRANDGQVCKFFGVDPSDIGVMVPGSSRSYQSVEAQQISLLVRTLGPWIVKLERAWSRLRPRGTYIRFNVEELTRLDTATLLKKIDSLIRDGVLNVNEGRQLLDRPGIGPAGDRYLWPPMRQQLDEIETALGADSDSPSATDPELQPVEPEPVRVPATNGNSGG